MAPSFISVVGNIMTASYVNAIASLTNLTIDISVPEMTIAELAENIENKELNRLVNIRVLDSSGWDNMYKNAISAEDVYAELGITQEDIDNADDVEFEVTPL
jgi:chemotaxis protein CheY-P-specific phosphatase CheC